ncbi:MAG: hypothetical protein UMV23_05970 [Halanaerobium sp.]|nr:hypothetical protein [Halanaerobium sp.]
MKQSTTNMAVTGLGVLVSGVGASLLKRSKTGAGILGFGLAHVALGVLDMFRPTTRKGD